MIRGKIAAVAVALSALAAQPAFPQAAIQEPAAFEFYHPNDDVLNGGAPKPAAALASTVRAQDAYAAIDDASIATRPGRHLKRAVSSRADASYCAQRWAYYDPTSRKAMGDDGEWRPCP
jgi:hypothetical protein